MIRFSDIRIGDYVIYINGYGSSSPKVELGRIAAFVPGREDAVRVCYHAGETAANTPLSCLFKLKNAWNITGTDLGGGRFRGS